MCSSSMLILMSRFLSSQGGYTAADRTVRRFWRILESFTPADQAALLRFITG